MDRREIFKIANLKEIQKEFNLPKLFCIDYCVGYDQCVYLLLSRQPQRREYYPHIMRFKKKEYYAIKLKMDWEKREVTEKDLYPLGNMPYQLEFLRPLNDCFLLIGSEKKKLNEEIIYEDDVVILSKESYCQEEDLILDLNEEREKRFGILINKEGDVVKKYELKKDVFDCQSSQEGQVLGEEGEEENMAVSEKREKVMISIKNYRWARYWECDYDANKNIFTDEKLVQMEYRGKYVKNVPNKMYGSKMLFWVDDETIGGHFFKENNRVENIDPKENREVFPIVDLEDLKKRYQIEEYDISDYYVGYDKKIYMLFCNRCSTVHKGNSRKPSEYREYIAVTLELDWIKGRVVDTQIFSLGRQDYYFYTIRPLKENFLLLGWKTKGKRGNKNGVLMSKNGEILRTYYFGPGIGKCCTTKDGIIYTGCDDYTLYDDSDADMSVNAWNEQGKRIIRVGKNVVCEAMNLADDGMFWHCDEYQRLIGTNLKRNVTIWVNDCVNGMAISEDGNRVIFKCGGKDYGSYYEYEYDAKEEGFKNEKQICFKYNGKNLKPESYEFCGSKMLFMMAGRMFGFYYR